MIKSSTDWYVLAVLAAIFSPALYGLASAAFRFRRGSVDSGLDGFKPGMAMHLVNAFLSPGVPAYHLYEDLRIGGGSMGSLLSFLILPITWIVFVSAQKRIAKASITV
ncbi:hypothetical protein [Roseateles sp. BYS96W]|uniref:Uncharacterized protein n=1 Tax=Pelomonas nitida TaxID=3299027 RepID=A0ABW7G4Y4_9BURK